MELKEYREKFLTDLWNDFRINANIHPEILVYITRSFKMNKTLDQAFDEFVKERNFLKIKR